MTKATGKTRWLLWVGLVGTVPLALGALLFGQVLSGRGECAGGQASGGQASGDGAAAKTDRLADRPPVVVTVEPLKVRTIQRTIEVVGSFQGLDQVTITPKVEGRVVEIFRDLGDLLAPGEPLLKVDPTDYKLAVEERARDLAAELAKLGLAALPEEALDAGSLDLPSIRRARHVVKNAADRLGRAARMPKGTLSEEALDQLETDLKVAEDTLQQVILETRGTLAAARYKAAQLATAQQRLRDTDVLAPEPKLALRDLGQQPKVTYVVAERKVNEGEIVRPGSSSELFKLVIDQPLKLVAAVPERYAGRVHIGQDAVIGVEAHPGREFRGTVARVSLTVDPLSRTFPVEILVPNEPRELCAGGFAKVSISTHVDPAAKTVPVEAVITFVGAHKVFVIESGRARAVPVTLGVSGRGWVEVLGDLPDESLMITSGHRELVDGMPVRVRQESP